MKERLEQRVLGAVQWIDHNTGAPIRRRLTVRSPHARFCANARHVMVVVGANGFDDYAAAFDPPLPAVGPLNVEATVEDPLGEYLPRGFSFTLPRSLQNQQPYEPDSVFRPVDVRLLPGAKSRLCAGWAEARVAVQRKTDSTPWANVLVRAKGTLADGAGERELGIGMSDARGEALVILARVPLHQPHAVSGEMAPTEVDLKFEFIPPPASPAVPDWTQMAAQAVKAANVLTGQKLDATRRLSFTFPVTP